MDLLHQRGSILHRNMLHEKCLKATELFMELHTEVFYLFFRREDIESLRRSHGNLLHAVSELVNMWKTQSYFLCRPDPNDPYHFTQQSLKKKEKELLDLGTFNPFFANKKSKLINDMKNIFYHLDMIRRPMSLFSTTLVTISVDHFESESYNRKAEFEIENRVTMEPNTGEITLDECIRFIGDAILFNHVGGPVPKLVPHK